MCNNCTCKTVPTSSTTDVKKPLHMNYKELRDKTYSERLAQGIAGDNTIPPLVQGFIGIAVAVFMAIFLMMCFSGCAYSANAPIVVNANIDVSRLADAIYWAEGSTTRPYGVPKYLHTTPRQACINTIKHALRRWNEGGQQGDFIEFLGNIYCPVKCNTLNVNWVYNVRYFYNHPKNIE